MYIDARTFSNSLYPDSLYPDQGPIFFMAQTFKHLLSKNCNICMDKEKLYTGLGTVLLPLIEGSRTSKGNLQGAHLVLQK
jgi:hypothetical protein